ncbi:hypothetical protein [Photobacterium leiognathi]|uniref:hypothetical protein n=1 Tax=Photobacterium leiognathi TaxID=553611 RepID=UPI0027336A1F|nr:hypothetical protein [Photobacterium leiognathi]
MQTAIDILILYSLLILLYFSIPFIRFFLGFRGIRIVFEDIKGVEKKKTIFISKDDPLYIALKKGRKVE